MSNSEKTDSDETTPKVDIILDENLRGQIVAGSGLERFLRSQKPAEYVRVSVTKKTTKPNEEES
jgi:hypothetical protein